MAALSTSASDLAPPGRTTLRHPGRRTGPGAAHGHLLPPHHRLRTPSQPLRPAAPGIALAGGHAAPVDAGDLAGGGGCSRRGHAPSATPERRPGSPVRRSLAERPPHTRPGSVANRSCTAAFSSRSPADAGVIWTATAACLSRPDRHGSGGALATPHRPAHRSAAL